MVNQVDSIKQGWQDRLVNSTLLMPRDHSNGRINRAGDFLGGRTPWPDDEIDFDLQLEDHLNVIDSWRVLHAFPLVEVHEELKRRAEIIDGKSLTAGRLKRFPSIQAKLRAEPNMALTNMQDIAGCRAVLSSTSDVYLLKAKYEQQPIVYINAEIRPSVGYHIQSKWTKDYISHPKETGYRGIHLVVQFDSKHKALDTLDGLRVEIQLRSRLQHAWAMAVETAGIATGQALKAGDGDSDWIRFFKCMSAVIALREEPPVVDPRTDIVKLRAETSRLAKELKVIPLLEGMSHIVEHIVATEGDSHFLMVMDSAHGKADVVGFKQNDFENANKQYQITDAKHRADPRIQVALVSVDSINHLRVAYPSYFMDSRNFVDIVRDQID